MNTGKGQSRVYFSEDSDKFVPRSLGSFGESDNGYRFVVIQHPIDGKLVDIYQEVSLKDRTQEYYTDGKLVKICILDKNGQPIHGNLIGNEEINCEYS